jgi:hypothetical protein
LECCEAESDSSLFLPIQIAQVLLESGGFLPQYL